MQQILSQTMALSWIVYIYKQWSCNSVTCDYILKAF